MNGLFQQGLLGQAFGGGAQHANITSTIGWSDSTSTSMFYPGNALTYYNTFTAPTFPVPQLDRNDPVAWLKERVKEIEWRA